MAPEILGFIEDDEEKSEYSNAVDIWSLGCILYNLSAQKVPFPKTRELNKYCQKRATFPREPLYPRMSQIGIEFIERLLVPQPAQRLTVESALNDVWLLNKQPLNSHELTPAAAGGMTGASLITPVAPSMFLALTKLYSFYHAASLIRFYRAASSS